MEMTFPVLSALVVAIVLALGIPGGNRSLGVLAASFLSYCYPGPMMAVILAGFGIYFFRKVFSK